MTVAEFVGGALTITEVQCADLALRIRWIFRFYFLHIPKKRASGFRSCYAYYYWVVPE